MGHGWLVALLAVAFVGCGGVEPVGASGEGASESLTERDRFTIWAFAASREARERQRRERGGVAVRTRSDSELEHARRRYGLSEADLRGISAEGEAKRWVESRNCSLPSEPVQMHALVVGPEPLRSLRATLPGELESEAPGVVILRGTISAAGEVRELTVLKSASAELDEAAKARVHATDWLPALLCGQPVDVRYSLTVTFDPAPGATPADP